MKKGLYEKALDDIDHGLKFKDCQPKDFKNVC